MTLASDTLRLQISNVFGGSDLPVTAAALALPANSSAGSPAIQSSTHTPLTFSGAESFLIPAGASILSDPVNFPVESGSIVSVSIYLADGQSGNEITSHPGSRTTSWFAHGDHLATEDLEAEGGAGEAHWYFISSIEGRAPRDAASLVVVGDSLADGRGSTTDGNDRWPDQLRTRLEEDPDAGRVAVVNQAAGGNRVLADGLGPNALGRIDRDVVAMPGTRYAIICDGINDIGTAATDATAQKEVGDRLIAAYSQIIDRLHRFDIAVFGATITPLLGPGSPYDDPAFEETRQRVNEWIRSSGRFDALVDFDKAVRDGQDPSRLRDEFNEGDHLHMNPEGYKAMAEAVDLGLFK